MTTDLSIRSIGVRWAACTMLITSIAGLGAIALTQNVTGTVTAKLDDVELSPGFTGAIQGVGVTFFDAATAEVLGSATTGATGGYDSGLLPTGDYRILFKDPSGHFDPRFYGGAGLFCSASAVPVVAGTTSVADVVLDPAVPRKEAGPIEVADYPRISGVVRAAATGTPLAGIEVRIFDVDARVLGIAVTNAEGTYESDPSVFVPSGARVRFSDPASLYFPEFFVSEAAGSDEFCGGTPLSFSGKAIVVDAELEPVPPAQLTEQLSDTITELNLPPTVESQLKTPLVQAVALLHDANPSNDNGVCGHLRSFSSRVDVQQRRGQMDAAQASALQSSAETIQAAFGCR